ncbi:FtsW/RodA/SpoVE family cell cycle protein, partial [Rhodococcus sp. CX]|uniref:FtsW/RodA/SpoVE family cell cycle protein n=3 Tax=unclassified Rhodococcus (in: high G+C Gram-positive bacteria) TaxID=192944 RepID=UPI001E372589
PFLRLLTATATTWIIGQAFINIGYVVGLLPVTGLQLPLVSAGGTSTATTLLMFGLIANAARHEPEAIAALHAGQDGRFGRLLRLRKPEAYLPIRAAATRAPGPRRGSAPARGRAERDTKARAADRRTGRTRAANDTQRGTGRTAEDRTAKGRTANDRTANGGRRSNAARRSNGDGRDRRTGERGNRR